jgi:hypothetical protein
VPAKGWGQEAVIWEGTPNVSTDLGMYAVYGLVPDPRPARGVIEGREITRDMYGTLWCLSRHPEAARARSAVTQALASLRTRGMMRRAVSKDERCEFGNVLTADGLEVGRGYAAEIPEIDLAIKVFMVRSRFLPWRDYRDELIRRLVSPLVPLPQNPTPARNGKIHRPHRRGRALGRNRGLQHHSGNGGGDEGIRLRPDPLQQE